MALTQIAQTIGKLAKSPAGKLGIAAVAVGVTASIFCSCTKKNDPPTINTNIDYDWTNSSVEELQSELENIQQQLQNPNLTPSQTEALKEQMYKIRVLIMDTAISTQGESFMGQPTQFKIYKDAFSQDAGKLNEFAEWHVETFPESCLKLQDYTPARAAYIVANNSEALNWYNEHFLKLIG